MMMTFSHFFHIFGNESGSNQKIRKTSKNEIYYLRGGKVQRKSKNLSKMTVKKPKGMRTCTFMENHKLPTHYKT